MRVAPAAAFAVSRVRHHHLHVPAEERVAQLGDPPRRLLRRVDQLLVARARPRRPHARDGEVVDVVIREAVARVAVDAPRDLVEALRPARREHLRDRARTRRTSSAAAPRPGSCRGSAGGSRGAPSPCPRGRTRAAGTPGAAARCAPALEEPLVHLRVPVDRAEHADGLWAWTISSLRAAEVLARHATKLPRGRAPAPSGRPAPAFHLPAASRAREAVRHARCSPDREEATP